jgi:serine/threonine-protein kinase
MDHRGDLYSVGVMMYELLTGRLPFTGPNSMDILLAHATEFPPTFAELGLKGWVPNEVEELVFDCLAKLPENRPQSARELAERFDTALDRARTQADSRCAKPDSAVVAPGSPVATAVAVAPAAAPTVKTPLPAARDGAAMPFHMEAWMPESIAFMKLRGFVHDAGGEVVESKSGLIRMRLGGRKGNSGALSWFGLRRSNTIELELRLHNEDPNQPNQLTAELLFHPSHAALLADREWQQRCTEIFVEIRSYLMGRSA